MSDKKNVPNYTRLPAKQITTEKRLEAVSALNAELLQLIGRHFPTMQPELNKINQSFAQNMAAVDALEGEMVLRGHGTRGVLLSQELKTEEDNAAFVASVLTPSEEPLSPEALVTALQNYLTIDIMQETGLNKSWVMPEDSMYGLMLFDGTNQANNDLLELPEGIYLVREEKRAFYTLKIELEDGILLFSPNAGPSIVSYSDIEQCWVQHTAWQYVNGPKAMAKIDAFFAKTSVRDVSVNELKKLDAALRKMPREELAQFATVTGTDVLDLTVKINDMFAIRLPADAAASILSVRDDLQWSDLSLFTRRQMYRELTSHILKPAAAPVALPEVAEEIAVDVDVVDAEVVVAETAEVVETVVAEAAPVESAEVADTNQA